MINNNVAFSFFFATGISAAKFPTATAKTFLRLLSIAVHKIIKLWCILLLIYKNMLSKIQLLQFMLTIYFQHCNEQK